MDEKNNRVENEIIRSIIYCKNYLGLDVFNEIDKMILIDLYGLDKEAMQIELVCAKYSIDIDYINELTMTYDNVKEAITIENDKKLTRKRHR